ncbi:MAG TPA: SPFH domain-containing protein [Streptosporangiaceae bacterium]|nr:SPFH domain-containing protein [Streptosporangiaceae bacterium]
MAILGREFIAAPDTSKGQIVFKWPDHNIRKFSRAIVEPDAVAVFVSQGQVMGTLPAGQHTLDARELPFLGMFVDWATNSNAFKAEIYFVGIRDFPSFRFGGRLDEVQDPQTGLIVTLRTFGEYALRVVDAPALILNLVGTVDVTSNDAITGWVAQQLLKVVRTTVTTQLMSGAWPILGLSVHSPEIEVEAMRAANHELAEYGLSIARLGNLDVNLDDDDNARLKKLAGDTAYSRLAGGFLQAAQAEALQGAGEGMAKGGEGVTPMFFGAGMGMANQMMQAPAQAPYNPPPVAPGFAGGGQGYAPAPQQPTPPPTDQVPVPVPAVTIECANCHNQVRVGSKFCAECGTPMQKHCTNCNASISPSAKFCAECGTPANPPAS